MSAPVALSVLIGSNVGSPVNPANWRKTTVQGDDGPIERWEYVSPAAENGHLKPLQDASRERHANANMQQAVRIALNNPARLSQAFAAAAVKWAQEVKDKPTENETEQWMREEAIVTCGTLRPVRPRVP